jgi:hypothetical protein
MFAYSAFELRHLARISERQQTAHSAIVQRRGLMNLNWVAVR